MTYITVPYSEVTPAMVEACSETSLATLRHSVGGVDRVVLKCADVVPSSLSGYPLFTHAQILAEMSKSDWKEPDQS